MMTTPELAVLRAKMQEPCTMEKAFWLCDGNVLHTLFELITALDTMDDFCFRYHVNGDHNKNDFADWIRDVFGDAELAMRLEGVFDRKRFLQKITHRLEELSDTSR